VRDYIEPRRLVIDFLRNGTETEEHFNNENTSPRLLGGGSHATGKKKYEYASLP
jgi:hypothetical protein